MRWLRNPEDAEDAVQEAMLSAFTSRVSTGVRRCQPG
jgi:DNA-directed RNA polymerase specialized sigma24 family protein